MNRTLTRIICTAFIALSIIVAAAPSEAAAPTIENGVLKINRVTTKAYNLSKAEIDLVCKIVHLEMCGETEEGQLAVASAIFNRLDSGWWGTSINDVIYAENQFETVQYLSDDLVVSDSIIKIVNDIVRNGVPARYKEVLHFRTDYYHRFGTPLFNIGTVYFSGV